MQVWGELEDESLVQLKHMSAPAFLALQVVKTKVPTLLLTWDEEPKSTSSSQLLCSGASTGEQVELSPSFPARRSLPSPFHA